MKVELYNQAIRAGMTRRRLLQGAAGLGGMAAMGGFSALPAFAQDNVRAEILKIPGVGAGSPTDADWMKVGEMCLGATKANVAEGEFADVMAQLRESRGDELIERRLAGGRPVLGIGVGMQILFDGAMVNDLDTEGLAQWPGVVTELDLPSRPHNGWSPVEPAPDSMLFAGIEDEQFHFAHSHAATEWTLEAYGAFASPRVTYATHGERFIAAVENGPLTATQFHPEKSGEAGLQLLRNWIQSL